MRSLLGLLLTVFGIPAFAQETGSAGDDTVTLDVFAVESEQDYGYRKTMAITATRLGSSILETPLNISVISSELIEDLARDNTVDLFNYTSSVKVSYDVPVGLSPGTADNGFKIRGFSTTFGYQDGVRRDGGFYVDGIDRAEVIKGPVGLYFGRTEPGGIINFITKRPQFTNKTRVRLAYGSYDYYKAMVDHQNTLIESKLAYRVVGSWRDSEDWQNWVTWDEKYLLANLTWKPVPTMEITFQYDHLDQFRTGGRVSGLVANLDYNRLLANDQLPIGDDGLAQTKGEWRQEVFDETGVAPRDFNGYEFPLGHQGNVKGPGAFDDIVSSTFLVDFKWKLAEGLNFRTVYARHDSDQQTFWPLEQEIPRAPRVMSALATGGDPNSATVVNFGIFSGAFFNPTWPNAPGKSAPHPRSDSYQADLSYEFNLLGGTHTFVGSFEYIDEKGRGFGLPTDNEAFIRAGGIPGNATGLGDDPYSAEANQILMAKRQQLVDWGLLGETQGFPFGDRIFGAYYIDLATTQPPDASVYTPNEPTADTFSGSDLIEWSWAGSWRARYFEDRLTIMAGIRETTFKSVDARIRDGVEERIGDWEQFREVTPSYGASFKIRDDLVAYASYSETFLPTGRNINETARNEDTGETIGGGFTAPERGEGWEIGLKSALWDNKLSGTLTYFSLSRADLVVNDPIRVRARDENEAAILAGEDPPWIIVEDDSVIARGNEPNIRRNAGKHTVAGIELEFIYTPVQNLQIISQVTHYNQREIEVPDPAIINVNKPGGEFAPSPNDGRDAFPLDPLENVPEWLFSTWAKYRFTEGGMKGFSFGFGGNYQSEEVHETRTNTQFEAFTSGDWWRFDLMLGYEWQAWENPMSLRFNVNNLFDKEYITGSFGPAPTRTWRLTMNYEF